MFSKHHWNDDVQNHIDLWYLCVVYIYYDNCINPVLFWFTRSILFKYIMLVSDW